MLLRPATHRCSADHCTINLKPVIDLPAGHTPIDAYEIPASLREQLLLRNPADVFPYAAALSRSSHRTGTWLWRSPHRHIYLVNATGTHPLGDTNFAETADNLAWRSRPAREVG